jgi:aspartokinase/homoserine dehydrogenase 1
VAKALNALHDAFFLSNERDINVFVVGTGLIAGELMRQLADQVDRLRKNRRLNIRLIGLTNTRKMMFNEEGIDLSSWSEMLDTQGDKADLQTFIDRTVDLNLTNSIFVDCSASGGVAEHYERLLGESISISTPNKVAASSSFLRYSRLKQIAASNSAVFGYETNVGAGLPVIGTLNDLHTSGDTIHRIDGVLSGSLSYIFNTYDGTKPFSEVVAEAGEKGFTEPDPRIDLSGKDVQRKIVILSREAGHQIELDDVSVEPFLSKEAFEAATVEDFFEVLRSKDDEALAKRYDEVKARGNALVMLGQLVDGKASVGLREVESSSPFFHLSGSDNMIVFTSERYSERPLVVRGPGAGASVTAAGVFAEIIMIGNLQSWE